MANVLEYVLRLSTGAFSGPMANVRNEFVLFKKEVNGLDTSAAKVNNMGSAFTGLAAKIGVAFAAIKAGTAVFGGLKTAILKAADMESTEVAFGTLIGNAELTVKTLAEIKALGAQTPFEFPELADSGRKLIAFGEGADTVADTLRRIGDVASGVQAPIGEIAEVFGKARVNGTLYAEDINQLLGRGIPILQEFAKILGVSADEIKKMASDGKITFPLLDQAFRNMTGSGGKFFGMMQQQSGTTHGLLSTLMDGFNELYLAIGQPINDALKPILQDAISLVGKLQPMAAGLGQAFAPALQGIRDFITKAEEGGNVITMLGEGLYNAFAGVVDVAAVPFRVMAAALPGVANGLMTILIPVGDWLSERLKAAALEFGATMARMVAVVVQELPLGGKAAAALVEVSDYARKSGEKSSSRADLIGSTLPAAMKTAGDEMMKAVVDSKEKLNSEIERFRLMFGPKDTGKKVDGAPAETPKADGKAPELESAISKALEKGAEKPKKEPASRAAASGEPDGSAREPARKKIMGFSFKKAGIPDFGGLDEYKALQDLKKMGVRPGERFSAPGGGIFRKPVDGAEAADATTARKARGFSGLAGFDALKKAKAAGVGVGEGFKAPRVQSPGAAKKEQERREAAAAVQRDRPRWDVVQSIEKRLASITVG